MGLCKCPKRSVTNLFCFEHRVNVCEYCLVANHSKCIVQSYVNWLQDSDYNPVCSMCNVNLNEGGNTVRLLCYHVFHWECMVKKYSALSTNTAPAGYTCHTCQEPLFPPKHQAGPVVDALKSALSGEKWAREGLGLPLLELERNKAALEESKPEKDLHGSTTNQLDSESFENTSDLVNIVTHHPAFKPTSFSESSETSHREKYAEKNHFNIDAIAPNTKDSDDNKYARRSLLTIISNFLKAHQINPTLSSSRILPNRKLLRLGMCSCFLLLFLLTAVVVLQSLSKRLVNDQDPMLNPKLNPNIHVENEYPVKI